jgi:thiol-disulfide isomerase/thioredoxin
LALAYLNEGQAAKALTALQAYKKNGGLPDGRYSYGLAEARAKLGQSKDALESYLDAAADQYKDAADKAKALYIKLNGRDKGFEARLEAKVRELPYAVSPFKPSSEWKGKAVLAEIFTGSECPPCVGADLGFDGLIESYPARYLAVLEYHLPIPRPDPMMNPATKKRQGYYGVNSTPTVFIDGEKKMAGGGSRGLAGEKFKQYAAEIASRLNGAPGVALTVEAGRVGDEVKVKCGFDLAVPGAEYTVVLVQGEEMYRGSNGIVFHKRVVRDLAELDPDAAREVVFNLASSEQASGQYLTDFEKTYDRIPNFRFAERHDKISRQGLQVVFFVQDKATKKVLNAAAAEVK